MERNLNELLQKGESKYLLVTVAAKRLKKLLNGEKPLVNYDAEEDIVNVALREIEAGKLKIVPRRKVGRVVDLAKQH
ncbi:DNA-directed RNA polymerase subunit omega [Candidatus Sumerlaeota bacterium]|nr:DNA-directed RNA polymerase subunit omega [Candidatus Sumerlaeota bacterium]